MCDKSIMADFLANNANLYKNLQKTMLLLHLIYTQIIQVMILILTLYSLSLEQMIKN